MKLHKVVIALIQLETAILLFLREQNYLCAITLAGAAEEIFGTFSKKKTSETIYEHLCKGMKDELNYKFKHLDLKFEEKEVGHRFLNFHRNELKHFHNPENEEIEIDPEFEAICLIFRAIYNMTSCKIITENAEDFMKWLRENKPELA